MKLLSFFSGAGGLDLGFNKAGFNIIWSNEYDKTIWETFEYNFPKVFLDKRSIQDIKMDEIPSKVTGIIGGPPCQSFSVARKMLGEKDTRGKLMGDYINIIINKKPLFFVLENVPGILHQKHSAYLNTIIQSLSEYYNIHSYILNAKDFLVPQDRKRVFIIGFIKKIGITKIDIIPQKNDSNNLACIKDLEKSALPSLHMNYANLNLSIPNHEYMQGSFSSIYMSRNRVRNYDELSFTIQASGRHIPIHPQAPKMNKIAKDQFIFKKGYENLYRRLTIRECARIQSFPDDFIFIYNKLEDGYKMVGNAVPVNLAYFIAKSIKNKLNLQ